MQRLNLKNFNNFYFILKNAKKKLGKLFPQKPNTKGHLKKVKYWKKKNIYIKYKIFSYSVHQWMMAVFIEWPQSSPGPAKDLSVEGFGLGIGFYVEVTLNFEDFIFILKNAKKKIKC